MTRQRHLLVFDMDGVLIDVSRSYRDTVRRAVRLCLQGARNWQRLPDPLFSLEELARVKQGGGLNNDWDLTYAILRRLFLLIDGPRRVVRGWEEYEQTLQTCDLTRLASFLSHDPRPLMALFEQGPLSGEPFVESLYAGDVGSGNVIKQIFQEIYLGRELFESIYGLRPRRYSGQGLIDRESPLIERRTLERLAGEHILAVATGRPRVEAEYALKRFRMTDFFDVMMTHDECVAEELRRSQECGAAICAGKPDPFMLDAIARRYPRGITRRYYVGDMPDDMLAASRSEWGYSGIGFVGSAPDKHALEAELKKAGADCVIETFEELPERLEGLSPTS